MKTTRLGVASLAAFALTAPAALAHTDGSHHGFAAGAAHMFTGLDHLAIALLVGIWAARSLQRRGAAVLAAYGGALLLAGQSGIAWPGAVVDGLLLGLLVAAGGLVLWNREGLTERVGSVLVVAMAAVQGLAHVADVGAISADPAFVTGLAVTTILAAGAFAAAAQAVRRRVRQPTR